MGEGSRELLLLLDDGGGGLRKKLGVEERVVRGAKGGFESNGGFPCGQVFRAR